MSALLWSHIINITEPTLCDIKCHVVHCVARVGVRLTAEKRDRQPQRDVDCAGSKKSSQAKVQAASVCGESWRSMNGKCCVCVGVNAA